MLIENLACNFLSDWKLKPLSLLNSKIIDLPLNQLAIKQTSVVLILNKYICKINFYYGR